MNRNDLRRVDLNLLIVFETLMHERSVTRAAEKLFLGQPAISAALSRLRGLFDDPLFVRTGRSMEPSARAVEIFALLSPALDSISTAVSRAAEFDPATSTAVFRIGLSDDVEFALLPPLLKRLRAEAPGIVLVIRRVNYILMPGLLASGEISIGVSYTADLPANAKRKLLRRSLPKLLRADSVPGSLSLDDFCARPTPWSRLPATSAGLLMKSWKNSIASAMWCWPSRNSTAWAPCWRAPTSSQPCPTTPPKP